MAVQQHLPRVGPQHPRDLVDQRRLARPIRPDQRVALMRGHRKTDVAAYPNRAEAFAKIVNFQHIHATDPVCAGPSSRFSPPLANSTTSTSSGP